GLSHAGARLLPGERSEGGLESRHCSADCHDDGKVPRAGLDMKESFGTSVGKVEVLVDEHSRTVSVYRFDAVGRPAAAAIESWDYTDLADLLTRQAGVPAWEANDIASTVQARVHL